MEDYIVTGTRAYGPARVDSDLDLVLDWADMRSLEKFLRQVEIEVTRTPEQEAYIGGGFYFNLGEIKVNIITANSECELQAWKYATEEMKKIFPPIDDRELRLERFRELFWGHLHE